MAANDVEVKQDEKAEGAAAPEDEAEAEEEDPWALSKGDTLGYSRVPAREVHVSSRDTT